MRDSYPGRLRCHDLERAFWGVSVASRSLEATVVTQTGLFHNRNCPLSDAGDGSRARQDRRMPRRPVCGGTG